MNKLVPILVTILTLWIILLIPFRIIGYGYLPPDDAMRHAAKAVSGKPWAEILVLRDGYTRDSHIGWHAILETIHKLTNWDAHSLVLFSVIFLFCLFSFAPVLFLRRPEAWPIALLLLAVAYPSFLFRLLLGRPYIVTMAIILIIGFLWPRLREKKIPYGTLTFFTILIAASTWIHCGWYLFGLPIAAFFLSREWRAGILFSIASLIGILIGAALTGHPYLFLKQTLQHVFLAFGNNQLQRMLVTEFQPSTGDFVIIIIVSLMLIWRRLRGSWNIRVIDNPVFILGVLCWALGFFTKRVWLDIGLAATLLWIAYEFQEIFEKNVNRFSLQRLLFSVFTIATLYAALTNDAFGRWSEARPKDYLSLEDEEQAAWLPEPGGIVYSDTMDVFYQTFFKNPQAPWRYILGFEPAIMPPDDLAIYRNIQLNYRAFSAFEPWVKKMRPEDRLIVRHRPGDAPKVENLEWRYAADQTWIGRLPRKAPQNK